MLDLRKLWNIGSVALSLLLPFLLGAYESAIRGAGGDNDLKFFPAALASAGLGLLLPCFPMGPPPASGLAPAAARAARRDYNWNAWVLVLAVLLFVAGGLLWAVALGYSIKGTYPAWWPAWSFDKALGEVGSEALVYYVLTMVLAICKLVKP
jgi:hypothetical protein